MQKKAREAVQKHRQELAKVGQSLHFRLVVVNSFLWHNLQLGGCKAFYFLQGHYGLFDEDEKFQLAESKIIEERMIRQQEMEASKKEQEDIIRFQMKVTLRRKFLTNLLDELNFRPTKPYKNVADLECDGYLSLKRIENLYTGYPPLEDRVWHKGNIYFLAPADEYLIGSLIYGSTAIKEFGLTRRILNKYFEPFRLVKNPHYRSGSLASLYRVDEIRSAIQGHEELVREMQILSKKREMLKLSRLTRREENSDHKHVAIEETHIIAIAV